MEILLIVLASFYCWTVLRFLLPPVPERLALLLYGGSTVALAWYPIPPKILLGLAAAGGLVLLTVLARIEIPRAWDWRVPFEMLRPRMPARTQRRMHPQDKPGPGRRIPTL
jgi:hypothetical protein